jgi:peroxiredoxin Q/BCP
MGVSFDAPEKNRAFAEEQGFTFPLLTDGERELALAYGACDDAGARFPARLTFVVSPEGVIEQSIETSDPAGQAQAILDALD